MLWFTLLAEAGVKDPLLRGQGAPHNQVQGHPQEEDDNVPAADAGGHEQGEGHPREEDTSSHFKLICDGFYTGFFKFFYLLCCVTGQLPINYKKIAVFGVVLLTILTVLLMLLIVSVNICSLSFDLYVIIFNFALTSTVAISM